MELIIYILFSILFSITFVGLGYEIDLYRDCDGIKDYLTNTYNGWRTIGELVILILLQGSILILVLVVFIYRLFVNKFTVRFFSIKIKKN